MDKETKRRVKITILGMLGLVALIIGISFAAFSADLAGVRIQSMNTGCLKVDMKDEGSINIENAMPEPDESGLSSDPYTYTITNSCSVDAYFTTTLNVMNTSNLDNLSKIKVALEGDSYLEPTMISNLKVGELLDDSVTGVSKTYVLDEGYLKVGESKTFELRTWIDYDVTSISGGLENKIIIGSIADNDAAIAYNKTTPAYTVINKNTILDKTNVDYSKISPSSDQTSGVVEVKQNTGTTYHFRGNPNNYLKFAGNDNRGWRILSTNSDGSINIVMEDAQNFSTIDYNDNLTTLYNEVLGLQSYENYIKTDAKFCVENGSEGSNYIAETKLKNHNPTGNCESNNTITKIGLLTVDDYMYAGGVNGLENQRFFLSDGLSYKINGYLANNNYYTVLDDTGKIDIKTANKKYAVKAVITLDKDTKLEGEGTSENPFYVSGKYTKTTLDKTDKTAPIIDKVSVDARWSNKNKSVEIAARDNTSGSGIAGYIVKTENKTPTLTESGWEAATSNKYKTANTFDNGTYYVFAKDNAGNISEGRKIIIEKVDKIAPTCTITINPNGTTAPYKTLSITSEDNYINNTGYSWAHNTKLKEDVIKVTNNGSYTAYLTDLAGNKGSCTAVVTEITEEGAAKKLIDKVGTGGLEKITHEADSTLQIGATKKIEEYRYRGSSPSNYVKFNGETWRIIGAFTVADESGNYEYRLKLIRNSSIGTTTDDTNNWENSKVNAYLNNEYYATLNADAKSMIATTKYYLGGNITEDLTAKVMYESERKTSGANYYISNYPTNYNGKLALMYVSDYGYAASGCDNTSLMNYSTCSNKNWLFSAKLENFITPVTTYTIYNVLATGEITSYGDYQPEIIRPVLYLKSSVDISGGTGTSSDPYTLSYTE